MLQRSQGGRLGVIVLVNSESEEWQIISCEFAYRSILCMLESG